MKNIPGGGEGDAGLSEMSSVLQKPYYATEEGRITNLPIHRVSRWTDVKSTMFKGPQIVLAVPDKTLQTPKTAFFGKINGSSEAYHFRCLRCKAEVRIFKITFVFLQDYKFHTSEGCFGTLEMVPKSEILPRIGGKPNFSIIYVIWNVMQFLPMRIIHNQNDIC